MNCFLASIKAHTHHFVHRALYTLIFFFYDKLVAHMCMYTFTISCMYSLHTCSCIHSMFSVNASTYICASSMTTDRLVFHEVFPCKYSCAYSSACSFPPQSWWSDFSQYWELFNLSRAQTPCYGAKGRIKADIH